jgi:hypothetical protein
MRTVTSFHADSLKPEELSAILADHLALERLRIFRRLFVTRFGILTAIVTTAGWLWLSTAATYIAAGLCLAPPMCVLLLEMTRERRLAQRLERIPGQRTDVLYDRQPV